VSELTDRELDAKVAEIVMGLPVVWSTPPYVEPGSFLQEGWSPYLKGNVNGCEYDWAPVPYYSSTGDGMLAVIERMRELDERTQRKYCNKLIELCMKHGRSLGQTEEWLHWWWALYITPQAVALAALAALEKAGGRDE